MLKEGDEIEWRDQEKAVRGLGLLLGGRWSALNVTENVGKQLVGFVDNLHTTEAEATEAKAKAQRKKEKEARDAKEAALSDDERAALRKERDRRKQERLEADAAKFGLQ